MKFNKRHVTVLLTTLLATSFVTAQDHDHDHDHSATESSQPTVTATVTPSANLTVGQPVSFTLSLQSKDGTPVTPELLEVAHTQKVHLLIIDPSLSDYHHEHPTPGAIPGTYEFTITPNKAGEYKIFADLLPTGTGKQEYTAATFTVEGTPSPIVKSESKTATVGGYQFDLKFEEEKFSAGHPHMAYLNVTGPDGKPFTQLEPVMGAYAHVVGFSEDRDEIAHIHPMGEEPKSDADRGGPLLEFHTDFATGGYKQLFVQVQIDGNQVFVPFGVEVMPEKKSAAKHAEANVSEDHDHDHGHESVPVVIPETIEELLAQVNECVSAIEAAITNEKLDAVHAQAFAARDLLVALPEKATGLSAEESKSLATSLARIKQQAKLLDKFGDSGDGNQTSLVLKKFKSEIEAIHKLVSNKEISDASAASDIKLANNTVCPVTGEAVGSMQPGAHVDYNGTRIGLCCMGCERRFQTNPESYLQKALAQSGATNHSH